MFSAYYTMDFPIAQMVKNLPAMQEICEARAAFAQRHAQPAALLPPQGAVPAWLAGADAILFRCAGLSFHLV